MIDDVIITLTYGVDEYDISDMLVPGSLSIEENACNSNYTSTLDSARWSIRFSEEIFFLLRDATDVISVLITDRDTMTVLFKGQIDPMPEADWTIPEDSSDISMDAVDFTVALDDPIAQSVTFPENVGDTAFYIYKRGEETWSILYWLLNLAGLSDYISSDAPDMENMVLHFAAKEQSKTYRELIDALLYDYGYVLLRVDGDMISWVPTALDTIENVDILSESDVLASGNHRVRVRKKFNTYDGVKVTWPKTKIMEDALLWRGSLPIGDSATEPHPGEPIASQDYWPEDSDIQETWMDFTDEYLDTAYLAGETRLRNDDLALIASSNHYINDNKDTSVELDPINETDNIIYEALRARLRYKNTGVEIAKLYWSKILGNALVQTALPSAQCPTIAKNMKSIESTHIYTGDDALNAAQREWMRMSKGSFDITFYSLRDLQPGTIFRLKQEANRWDDFILVISRQRVYDQSGVWKYQVVSTAAVEALEVKLSSLSGASSGADPTDTSQNLSVSSALLKPGTTDEREDFEVKITTGIEGEETWDIAPEFFIKTGGDYLLAIDNNFLDTADDSTKKRALINGNGDFAITNKHIYLKNVNADGLSAKRVNIHGNVETEIFINPGLIAQPSNRDIINYQTLQVQDKQLAYDLCVWAQSNGISFNVLHRCEVSEESEVGWMMFAPLTALGTWGSSEIECYVYLYKDDGTSIYTIWSKSTLEEYEVQNEWIFGWPWFGTHTETEWVTYGSVTGDIEAIYDGTRGGGFVVAPVQSVDPEDYLISIPGYGVDLRNNTDVTVDGITCDGFTEAGGQNMAFRCYFGSDYDVLMKKLPGNDTATVDALPIGALYRGAGDALLVKWS